MENEEIRLNRYCKICPNYETGCDWLCRGRICDRADAYELGLDYKDQQLRKYLDKLEERCDKEYADVAKDGAEYNQGEAFGKLCLVVEIINELFGED